MKNELSISLPINLTKVKNDFEVFANRGKYMHLYKVWNFYDFLLKNYTHAGPDIKHFLVCKPVFELSGEDQDFFSEISNAVGRGVEWDYEATIKIKLKMLEIVRRFLKNEVIKPL